MRWFAVGAFVALASFMFSNDMTSAGVAYSLCAVMIAVMRKRRRF